MPREDMKAQLERNAELDREIAEERQRLLQKRDEEFGAGYIPDPRPEPLDGVPGYTQEAIERLRAWNMRDQARRSDPVNHPSHYADGEIECIEAMRQIAGPGELEGFCRLSAFKYLWRLGKKGKAAEDAAKAEVYCRWLKESLDE